MTHVTVTDYKSNLPIASTVVYLGELGTEIGRQQIPSSGGNLTDSLLLAASGVKVLSDGYDDLVWPAYTITQYDNFEFLLKKKSNNVLIYAAFTVAGIVLGKIFRI
jgi:hypothetical protein